MNNNEQSFIASAIRFSEQQRLLRDAADKFYASIESAANPPLAVRRSIVLKFVDDLPTAYAVLKRLSFDAVGGYYHFTYAGMFHGVEPDGYIHT